MLQIRHPRLIALGFGLACCIVLVLISEVTFRFLNQRQKRKTSQDGGNWSVVNDPVLGYKRKANAVIHASKSIGTNKLYDVVYTMDSLSRRLTPIDPTIPKDRFIAFFGCSFCFGEGLNDNQTIPCFVASDAPRYMPYNYGCYGYGPQQMLAKLQSGELRSEIDEPKGIAVYIFFDEHVDRVIGTMNIYNMWGKTMPYYFLDHGQLKRDGNFTTGRPLISRIYRRLGKSETLKYFHVNFPMRINGDHIRLTAEVIRESQRLFTQQFEGSDFYVLFYPAGKLHTKQIIPCLLQSGIKYLDYTSLFARGEKDIVFPGDGHPTAHATEAVARKLVADLKLNQVSAH